VNHRCKTGRQRNATRPADGLLVIHSEVRFMALSEYEQRQLEEMESALRRDDPGFAASVSIDRVRRRRRMVSVVVFASRNGPPGRRSRRHRGRHPDRCIDQHAGNDDDGGVHVFGDPLAPPFLTGADGCCPQSLLSRPSQAELAGSPDPGDVRPVPRPPTRRGGGRPRPPWHSANPVRGG